MKIDLSWISEGVESSLSSKCFGSFKSYGQVRDVHHQADNRIQLMTDDPETKIVTIDSIFETQIAYLVNGVSPMPSSLNFGLGGQSDFRATVVMMVASKRVEVINHILSILSQGPVTLGAVNTNTLEVLRNRWRMVPGPDKNYDPALHAWAIELTIFDLKLLKTC